MFEIIHWLISTEHKTVSVLYLYFGFLASLLGISLSSMLRQNLSIPEVSLLVEDFYNNILTSHGIIMIFFIVMPLLIGFYSNWMLPIFLGSPDMAFPRINALSLWLLPLSYSLMVVSMVMDCGPSVGWTLNPPLSTDASTSTTIDLVIFSLHVAGVSSILGSINFVVSVGLLFNSKAWPESWFFNVLVCLWFFGVVLVFLLFPFFIYLLQEISFCNTFNLSSIISEPPVQLPTLCYVGGTPWWQYWVYHPCPMSLSEGAMAYSKFLSSGNCYDFTFVKSLTMSSEQDSYWRAFYILLFLVGAADLVIRQQDSIPYRLFIFFYNMGRDFLQEGLPPLDGALPPVENIILGVGVVPDMNFVPIPLFQVDPLMFVNGQLSPWMLMVFLSHFMKLVIHADLLRDLCMGVVPEGVSPELCNSIWRSILLVTQGLNELGPLIRDGRFFGMLPQEEHALLGVSEKQALYWVFKYIYPEVLPFLPSYFCPPFSGVDLFP